MRFRPLGPASPAASEVAPAPPSMRAKVLDHTGDDATFRTAVIPTPTPVMSEVLVRVVAAGVDPIDVETRAGRGVADAVGSYPATLGVGFSGVVVHAPFESHPFPPGTEVFGVAAFPRTGGTYAEYAVVPSLALARKPAALSHVEAAGVPMAALTAWGLIVDTALAHEGQHILVHGGSGGVGHLAVQIAAYFGARVTATGSASDLTWLRELGAHTAVDETNERFEERVADVDVVIDLVGNAHAETGSRSLSVLRPGGLLLEVPTGDWPDYAQDAADAGVRVTGYRAIPDGSTLATIARLLDSGAIQAYVGQVFALDDVAEAHAEMERGRTRGALVLRVSDD